jgi:5-methylcytosine-specific restriction protein A
MPTAPKALKPAGSSRPDGVKSFEEVRRGSSTARGYDAQWRRLRLIKLQADPLCEHCLNAGEVKAAVEVDHIKRFRDRLGRINHRLRLDIKNLQSLCTPCHARKTQAERRG